MNTSPRRDAAQPSRLAMLPTPQMPCSIEAEEAVNGAILINPGAFIDVAQFLVVEDFYYLRLGYIWTALSRLAERHDPIDYLTVQEELKAMGKLDDVGGPAYLIQLMNNTPTSMHAEIYGRLVERLAIRRRLMAAADEIKGLAMNEDLAVEQVKADAEQRFTRVWERQIGSNDETWSEVLQRQMDGVEARMEHPGLMLGLPTGFREIDELLAGLQSTDLILLAGRPGMGKTSLLLGIALNIMRQGGRVGMFSQEMGRDQIADRMVSTEMALNLQKLRLGALDLDTEWRRYVEAVGRVGKMPFFLDDASGANPLSVRAKALRWQRQHGLDLVIIDYVQLMNGGGRYENDRVKEVGYISRELKGLAKELHVPVLAAAQLSRAVEERQDKRPQLSDLRESGELEQNADVVMFLYRDVVYNPMTEFPNRADVITAKHRNGPTGVSSLHFDKAATRFSDERTGSIDLSTGERL